MSTDLTTVPDHPAAVLANHPTLDAVTRGESAAVLRTYEQRHGVTFAALDNDALAALRAAWAMPEDAQNDAGRQQQVERWAAIEDAARDLLGLED